MNASCWLWVIHTHRRWPSDTETVKGSERGSAFSTALPTSSDSGSRGGKQAARERDYECWHATACAFRLWDSAPGSRSTVWLCHFLFSFRNITGFTVCGSPLTSRRFILFQRIPDSFRAGIKKIVRKSNVFFSFSSLTCFADFCCCLVLSHRRGIANNSRFVTSDHFSLTHNIIILKMSECSLKEFKSRHVYLKSTIRR